MARKVITTDQFKKDLKVIRRRVRHDESKLEMIIKLLRDEKSLKEKCQDHSLSPPYNGCRGCKMEKDWILVYKNKRKALILMRTGSHSDLFENPVIW